MFLSEACFWMRYVACFWMHASECCMFLKACFWMLRASGCYICFWMLHVSECCMFLNACFWMLNVSSEQWITPHIFECCRFLNAACFLNAAGFCMLHVSEYCIFPNVACFWMLYISECRMFINTTIYECCMFLVAGSNTNIINFYKWNYKIYYYHWILTSQYDNVTAFDAQQFDFNSDKKE